MTAPAIPVGAADLADRLAVWRTILNSKLPGAVAVKPADTNRNTTTTFANDPDLTLAVAANKMYKYELYLNITAGATPQMKVQLTSPSGASLKAGTFRWNGTVNAPTGATHTTGGITGTDTYYVQEGIVRVGATAGSLTLQWAQSVSNGTNITIHQGSFLLLTALN